MTVSSPKISVDGVAKAYGSGRSQVLALDGLNLSVRAGEFCSVVGPSGCGKSTLLLLISGLERPTAGAVLVDGRRVDGVGRDRGMVFQDLGLFPWRSVRANVRFPLEGTGRPRRLMEEAVATYTRLCGLAGFEDRLPHELSGGMRQRVALARVLVYSPAVILMDEPFGSLDAQTRELMQQELLRIWADTGGTVVFVTHSVEEAAYLSDTVHVMTRSPGRIKTTFSVDLARPRRIDDLRSDRRFLELCAGVRRSLREEVPCF